MGWISYLLGFPRKESSFLGVSIELSSRAVARKVFSPLQSLTSVFGMGTGGPSAFVTLTILTYLKEHFPCSLKIEQQIPFSLYLVHRLRYKSFDS